MASDPATGISNAPPRGAADRIEPHSQPLGQHDEGHHGQSGQRANQQREQQKNLLLALLKQAAQPRPEKPRASLFPVDSSGRRMP